MTMLKRRTLLTAASAAPFLTEMMMTDSAGAAVSNTLLMELTYGPVTIELRPDLAPLAAARLRTLSAEGFYNGCKFFRVIAGFMAQTGDPTNTGMHGSSLPDLPAEFTN